MAASGLGEEKARLARVISEFNLGKLLPLLCAFAWWNGSPRSFPQAFHIVQDFATLANGEGSRKPSPPACYRLLREYLRLSPRFPDSPDRPPEFYERSLDERFPQDSTLASASSQVSNPGTHGQMLMYAEKKFSTLSQTLEQRLGFDAREACITARILHRKWLLAMAPYLQPGERAFERRFGSRRGVSELEVPPSSFLLDWVNACEYNPGEESRISRQSPNSSVVEFLSCPAKQLGLPGPSTGRWAFSTELDGRRVLLVPDTLIESTVSALHMGLFAGLPAQEQGEVGVRLGEAFEGVVVDLFASWVLPSAIRRNEAASENSPEADLLISLPSGGSLLVQCKGRARNQRGRWGDKRLFLEDLKEHLIRAGHQAQAYLDQPDAGDGVLATMLVLDGYFPFASFYSTGTSEIADALRGLPSPMILTYYDLDYLLRKIGEEELRTYLDWRGPMVAARSLVVFDEFDAVRAYLKFHESLPAAPMIARKNAIMFTGFDPEFEVESLKEADEALGIDWLIPTDNDLRVAIPRPTPGLRE